MKKAFLTLATIVAALSMTAGAQAAASCEKEAQAAGEDFATKYMDIGVIPANTIMALQSGGSEDLVYYAVMTVNHDATRFRSVRVGVNPNRLCQIQSLEAAD
ncbi:MAG: hypothetical protein JNJ49_14810 [Bdellovibrionaceae bacterium]|nr:hypothetical protein [Pseudobdellovibrionaceae bacterium]